MNKEKKAHYAYSHKPVKSMEYDSPNTKIGVTPGAVVGAITGAVISSAITKKKLEEQDILKRRNELKNRPRLDGNYYKQVQSVVENLSVAFTPVSAIYMLKDKGNTFTLDTVEVSEMNPEMKKAHNEKNENYFKGLMISKMYSEVQAAEQQFTKQFLEKQMSVRNCIDKNASESEFYEDELSDFDVLACGIASKEIYKEASEAQALAQTLSDLIEKTSEEYEIELALDRPFNKYAGVISGITDSLGLHTEPKNVKAIKKKLDKPKHVMSNVKVGFLPDRVVYSVDGVMISTVRLSDMKEEDYDRFQNEDAKYFRSLFVDRCKQELSKTASVIIDTEDESKQRFNPLDSRNMFYRSDTHPVVFYLSLTYKYGYEWLEFDTATIQKILEDDFMLDESISDISFDKIMAIHAVNNAYNVYTNAFAFEKIILSLTEKPVDFFNKQSNLIDIDDIVYAIDVIDRVTPTDDIYDNFSDETLDFICGVLADKNLYAYNPSNIVSSPTEPAFNELVNESLVRIMKHRMIMHTDDTNEQKEIIDRVEYIANTSFVVLKTFRRYAEENPQLMNEKSKVIDMLMVKTGVKEEFVPIIKDQILINLAVDDILALKENALKTQLEAYRLNQPNGGEINEQ